MWVRKTSKDQRVEKRANERQMLNPGRALFGAGACAALVAIFHGLGFRGRLSEGWVNPGPFMEAVTGAFIVFIGVFVFLCIVFYAYQLITGRRAFETPDAAICNKCFTPEKRNLLGTSCRCGGQFEPLENWKWEDNKNA